MAQCSNSFAERLHFIFWLIRGLFRNFMVKRNHNIFYKHICAIYSTSFLEVSQINDEILRMSLIRWAVYHRMRIMNWLNCFFEFLVNQTFLFDFIYYSKHNYIFFIFFRVDWQLLLVNNLQRIHSQNLLGTIF